MLYGTHSSFILYYLVVVVHESKWRVGLLLHLWCLLQLLYCTWVVFELIFKSPVYITEGWIHGLERGGAPG